MGLQQWPQEFSVFKFKYRQKVFQFQKKFAPRIIPGGLGQREGEKGEEGGRDLRFDLRKTYSEVAAVVVRSRLLALDFSYWIVLESLTHLGRKHTRWRLSLNR